MSLAVSMSCTCETGRVLSSLCCKRGSDLSVKPKRSDKVSLLSLALGRQTLALGLSTVLYVLVFEAQLQSKSEAPRLCQTLKAAYQLQGHCCWSLNPLKDKCSCLIFTLNTVVFPRSRWTLRHPSTL